MTTVQNLKYMQSIYRKYQIFAIVCTLLTLITASLAALTGIQLNDLRRSQTKNLENETLTSSQVNADVQKELKETKLFLRSSQQQLNEEKEKVERMQQMLNALERQLSTAQAKAALKAVEAPPAIPKPEKSPEVSATPRVRKHPDATSKPAPPPTPSANEPPSDKINGSSDTTIPAPSSTTPEERTQNTSSE